MEYWPSVVFVRTCFTRSVLPPPQATIPQFGPRAQLVRSYYFSQEQPMYSRVFQN